MGINYIKNVYQEKILLGEQSFNLKNREEAFLLFVLRAIHAKDSDIRNAYYDKAKEAYNELANYLDMYFTNSNTILLEQKQEGILDSIRKLIWDGKFEDAEGLLLQFTASLPGDTRALTLLGLLYLLQDNLEATQKKKIHTVSFFPY